MMQFPRLHNLSALRDFECAARWSSFKLAGQELNKTAAAVSQQIKQLERQLGFELFTRFPRHIALTGKGEEFSNHVQNQLTKLDREITRLRELGDENILRITATHSFSLKWLAPRIGGFTKENSDIDVRLYASDKIENLESEDYDLAIRYREKPQNPDEQIDWLMDEKLIAVHSPSLSKVVNHALRSDEIMDFQLLHEGSPRHWLSWIREHDLSFPNPKFNSSYSHSGILVQAAVAGQGIALVPSCIAKSDLSSNQLLQVPGPSIYHGYGYCILHSSERKDLARVQAFSSWLKEQFERDLS
ncbi:LysR substrate-binding domain-containing protein [Kiloniella antarctica]|uniref:LysR substrate-binding domain-containing protein n=1 Tax=Kiloniella antarctica TaxID=1550907 RepID=A0ABW5BIW9_9PROT